MSENVKADSATVCVIMVGRRTYTIRERDKFMDNGASVQLLTQKGPLRDWNYTTVSLPKREIKHISRFQRVQVPHEYGPTVQVFSLKAESNP